MESTPSIFVSHASEDAWVTRQIAEKIRGLGAKTFLDEDDLDVVDEPNTRLREELSKASELLVLITPWSHSRAPGSGLRSASPGAASCHLLSCSMVWTESNQGGKPCGRNLG